jgi:tetratricopeptide (TPR) repeat protein
LLSLGQFVDAIAAFDRALVLNPVLPQALCNRGIAHQRMHQYRLGLDDFNRCIELELANSKLYFNRGSLLFESGDIAGALASYDSAILLDSNNAEAQFNKALLYLAQKEFQRGWDLYEWRFVNPKEPQAKLKTALPVWDHKNPSHQRVLLWAEQGVGDQVLFGTMLKDASKRIPVMTVMPDQRLIPIFERSLPGVNFLPLNLPVKEDDFDAHFSMMSLGSHYRQHASDFLDADSQYLLPDLDRAAVLRRKLACKGELLCGIFWKSRLGKNGLKKSLELMDLLPILQIPGVKFVNLQYGDTLEECRMLRQQTGVQIINCDEVDNFNDLEGHAALIQACDFLVGCSNSSAHLAGALGKKMYLALAHGSGILWYWANEVEGRSLWYPSIKIYRQPQPGNWAEPIEAIRAELLEFV